MTTKKPTKKPTKTRAKSRPVLVTTQHRGVFFGYATETNGTTITLRRARCVIYWPRECKGFLGLASIGPIVGSRVGPAADVELRDVTCIADVSAEAVARFEAAPWS